MTKWPRMSRLVYSLDKPGKFDEIWKSFYALCLAPLSFISNQTTFFF